MLAFKHGANIRWNKKTAVIRCFEKDLVVIQFEGGRTLTTTPSELLQAYEQGALVLVAPAIEMQPHPTLTAEQKKSLDILETHLKLLDQQEHPGSIAAMKAVIAEVMPELEQKYGPLKAMSPATLNRKYRRWLEAGKVAQRLLIKPMQTRSCRIEEEVQMLMDEVINEVYLKNRHLSISYCFRIFKNRYRQAGYLQDCPSRNTFENRIKKMDPYHIMVQREGAVAARRKFRSVLHQFEVDSLMQRVEMDAVQPNIELIDVKGNNIGKPVVFLILEVYSRTILGYSISYGGKGETAAGAIECVRHSIFPKTRERYPHTEHIWPMYGIPTELVCDAGAALTSDSFGSFLATAGITRLVTETKQPWKKPFIERFIRTLRLQCFARMPGYGGKRSDDHDLEETLQQQASLRAEEFERIMVSYIVDEYHQAPHDGLKKRTPTEVWNEQVLYNPLLLPENIDDLNNFAGIERVGTIQAHKGMQCENVFFNSMELGRLYQQIKQEKNLTRGVKVRYYFNDFDISRILVINPLTAELLSVPAIDKRIFPSMTLSQYKAQLPLLGPALDIAPVTDGHPDIQAAQYRQNKLRQDRKKAKAKARPPARPLSPMSDEEQRALIDAEQQKQSTSRHHQAPSSDPDEPQPSDMTPDLDQDDIMKGFDLE